MTDTLHQQGQQASPCVMVIFGASGDLTKRKLIPALCNLAKSRLLSPQFAVIGFSYDSLTTEAFRAQLSKDIKGVLDNMNDGIDENRLIAYLVAIEQGVRGDSERIARLYREREEEELRRLLEGDKK